jgi:hypothetical protein
MANPFENIRAKAGDQDRSFRWYQDNVRKVAANISSFSGASKTDLGEFVSKMEPGNMYMYVYDAKYKDVLPYYDQFPLCLPFDDISGGFVGINLHYLPYMQRAKLLGELLSYTDNELNDDSKLKIKWSLLKNFGKFPQVQPSVKRYLNAHVKSRLFKINPQHWKSAIFLPTHNFVGASIQKVYTDSRNIING